MNPSAVAVDSRHRVEEDCVQESQRFGRIEIRPAQRAVTIDGRPAPLGARAFDVLVALVDRRDRLVGKDELLDIVWPGLVVEENNLAVHVSALRKMLGPQPIATVPGRGYRFVAPAGDSAAAPAAPPVAAEPPHAADTTALPPQSTTLFGRDDDLAAL